MGPNITEIIGIAIENITVQILHHKQIKIIQTTHLHSNQTDSKTQHKVPENTSL